MKKIIITILFCVLFLPFVTNAENVIYSNPSDHYSFVVPDGWTEIPKTMIDQSMQQAVDQSDVPFTDYVAGFQLINKPVFQHPYILIQKHKVNAPSYSQITKTFQGDKFSEIVNRSTNEYSELATNASVQDPFIDKENNIIFINMETDVANAGKVKAMITMFLGKESITQLNFYSLKSEYSENLPIFNQIIESFQYEQGYEYNEEDAKKNDSPSIFDGALEKGVAGGLIVGIIVVIMEIFSRFKKKGQKIINNK